MHRSKFTGPIFGYVGLGTVALGTIVALGTNVALGTSHLERRRTWNDVALGTSHLERRTWNVVALGTPGL